MAGRLLALAVVVAALLALPSAAHALDCSMLPNLTDGAGFEWQISNDGGTQSLSHDGVNSSGRMYFGRDYDYTYVVPFGLECGSEDGDREYTFPELAFNGDALRVSLKVYVPSAGAAFVRHLWSFRNTDDAPRTVDVWRRNETAISNMDLLASSSGDAAVTPADDWFTWDNQDDATDPTLALIWQGPGARRASVTEVLGNCCPPEQPLEDGSDDAEVHYGPIEVPAGQTVTLMQFLLARGTNDGAREAAEALVAASAEALAGMTDDELRALYNFALPDADRDGVANDVDNCQYVVNADQANADGDAQGNACDSDDDNDGIGDELELLVRTDPLRADGDGDGKSDRDDSCPTVASTTANGCPLFDQIVSPINGRVDPGPASARLTPGRDQRRPFRFTATGSILPPAGLTAQQACGSRGLVALTAKRGRRTIGTARARLRANCTFRVTITFRTRRKIGRGRRTLNLTIAWLGNRFMAPVTIRTLPGTVG